MPKHNKFFTPHSGKPPEDISLNAYLWNKIKKILIGGPRNIRHRKLFHRVALIPILAWVGMGADGLSSSVYGPEDAFKSLGKHLYLVPLLILATVATITIITIAYNQIIEHFPHGGGGYLIASKLLGPGQGLIYCALEPPGGMDAQ